MSDKSPETQPVPVPVNPKEPGDVFKVDLASDRNPTPEEIERYPSADKASGDLSKQTLKVLDVVSPDEKKDEPEKEVTVVDNRRAVLDFEGRLALIDAALRKQVDGYKRNETAAIKLLVNRNSTVAIELDDMVDSLNKAARSELTYKTALSNMIEKLESLHKLLRDEAGEIDDISAETEKFGSNVNGQKNGELADKKSSFIKETGINEGETLYIADTLDYYMQHAVDSVDAVLSAIKSAKQTNGNRQDSVGKLIHDIETALSAGYSDNLDPDSDEVTSLEGAVRRLAHEFDDDSNSHLTTIGDKIDSISA
jgi:hypothetical protein